MTTTGTPIAPHAGFSLDDIRTLWPDLSLPERVQAFRELSPEDAQDFFLALPPEGRVELIRAFPTAEQRLWLRLAAPDDVADVIQQVPEEERDPLLNLLNPASRTEVTALMAYQEDAAGGLMNPRFPRVRPDITVDQAIRYLRRQTRQHMEAIYYVYVLSSDQKLLGVASFRDLLAAPDGTRVSDVMESEVVSVTDTTDQEQVAEVMRLHDLLALPVVDGDGRMKGIVTYDDIVDVVTAEATEDIQKLGGSEALDAPYLQTPFLTMVRKRASWLSILFVGEMFTATALGYYQNEIAASVVLALFLPMIISSGGNSGSQASTLVIRALALGETRLRDWWRVFRHEISAGVALGCILAVIGFARVLLWQGVFHSYGAHFLLVALTVACSLIGVVLWGTVAGSMLPFVLRRFGLDPASASAPFIATLSDVTGVVIYFTVAHFILLDALH